MEAYNGGGAVCYPGMALKSANAWPADTAQTHHTQAGLPMCCEQALGGCQCGGLRETARAKDVTLRGGGLVALLDIEGGDLAAGGPRPAGELLTGNIGSLRESWQLLRAKSASRSLRTYTPI
jgi:hypothetical protein